MWKIGSRWLVLPVQAEAQQLEMATLRKFGAGIGAPTRQEQITDAADIHIKLGNVQRYCELMIELGQVLSYLPQLTLVYWLNYDGISADYHHQLFIFYVFYFSFVLWGAPNHRLRGAIVSLDDEEDDDDDDDDVAP